MRFEIYFKAKLYVFLWFPGGVFLHRCFRGCGAQSQLSQKVKQSDAKFFVNVIEISLKMRFEIYFKAKLYVFL